MGLYSWNGIYISSTFFYDQHLGEDRCLPFGPVAFRVCAHYPFTQLYGYSRCHLPANCVVQFTQRLCPCCVCLVYRQQCKAPTDSGRNSCERGGRTGSVRKIATKRMLRWWYLIPGRNFLREVSAILSVFACKNPVDGSIVQGLSI